MWTQCTQCTKKLFVDELEDGHANRTTNVCNTSVTEGEVARAKLV